MAACNRRTFNHALLAGLAGTIALPAARTTSARDARWNAPSVSPPATAAGVQLTWALDQINRGGSGLTERELRQRFTGTFLAALPAKALLAVFTGYLAPNGPMTLARFEGPTGGSVIQAMLTTPGSDWRVTLGIDPAQPDLIDQLFFTPVTLPAKLPKPVTRWSQLQSALSAIAPRVSFLAAEIIDDGFREIAAITKERTLALGSTFKLYVLAELTRQIDSGEARWDEPLAIRDDLRSLPNGDMRLLPAGTTFPLRVFAERMIAASDNTATDHLITRLGRERVESAFPAFGHARPERNVPLLLTREWFAFKLRVPLPEVETYLAAGVATKRALLATEIAPLAATLTDQDDWVGSYLVEEIEWFASAADLCRVGTALLRQSAAPGYEPVRTAFSMNPGIPFDARTWAYVGYKGGYETGVKSDLWLLQRGDGRWFILAVIINDPTKEIRGVELWQYMVPATDLLAAVE